MFDEYKYKTELHAHTTPASGCSQITPEYMVEVYKKGGYTSIALTNHFIIEKGAISEKKISTLLNDYKKTKELGEKAGLNIIFGAEIRFSDNFNDYLIYGIEEDDLEKIYSLLDFGIDNFYRTYKNDKNIIIQAHPFREVCTVANPCSIDGIEVFNVHPGHNSKIAVAAKFANEHNKIVTAGTDFHHHGHECLSAILTKEPILDSFMLASVLKNRDYLINIGGCKVLPY